VDSCPALMSSHTASNMAFSWALSAQRERERERERERDPQHNKEHYDVKPYGLLKLYRISLLMLALPVLWCLFHWVSQKPFRVAFWNIKDFCSGVNGI